MRLFGRGKKEQQERLEESLEGSRSSFFGKLERLVRGKNRVDESVLDDLEEALVTSDVGVRTTLDIIARVEERVARDRYVNTAELKRLIRDEMARLLQESGADRPASFDAALPNSPHVILVVGVNGVGKTTTIGKLAFRYREAGRSVLLGAADTFRAAAIEQLEVWATRADVPVIRQQHGSDPAAVAFDTLESARRRGVDVVIIDTAGRLHTKTGLMDELSKIRRVLHRQMPGAPHEVLLVLDASIGQNALRQAEEFTRSVDVTGLVITKLDGTARGGIVLGISHEFKVPVKYIGVGERLDDLQVFDRRQFVSALYGDAGD